MNFFRLCPSYEMHAPVSNHKPVQCEPYLKIWRVNPGGGREGAIILTQKAGVGAIFDCASLES